MPEAGATGTGTLARAISMRVISPICGSIELCETRGQTPVTVRAGVLFPRLSKFTGQDLGLQDAVHVGRALGVKARAQVKHLSVGLGVIDRVQRLLHGEVIGQGDRSVSRTPNAVNNSFFYSRQPFLLS